MTRPATSAFALAFVVSVAAFLSPFPIVVQSAIGVCAIGIFALVVHHNRAQSPSSDERLDACYFLGFLQTLVFLALALWRSAGDPDHFLSGFLQQLALGLGFSISGLFFRQLLVLSATHRSPTEIAVGALAGTGAVLPDHVIVGEAEPDVLGEPALHDRHLRDAAEKITALLGPLETAVNDASANMTRAGSHMSTSLTDLCARLSTSVELVVGHVTSERQKLLDVLQATGLAAEATQKQMTKHAGDQLAEWARQVSDNQALFVALLSRTEDESRRALDALGKTTSVTTALAESITRSVETLPNPADRIKGVWSVVGDAERTLGGSVTGLAKSLNEFETAVRSAGGSSTEMRAALDKEAKQIRKIVDELYGLLENRIVAAGKK